jgi:predicted house-cleaning NTP pyrophosphatase (Maf/HAM1 superfamily)
MIYAMLEADSTMVVARTADGKPLTVEEYNKELEKAELQRAEGKVYTHDEVKDRVSQWLKNK